MSRRDRAAWGRRGGLVAWSRNDPETMVGPAHAGFRRRFERAVDPDEKLSVAERARRADRALRAHMLELAERSAAVRAAKRRPDAGSDTTGAGEPAAEDER